MLEARLSSQLCPFDSLASPLNIAPCLYSHSELSLFSFSRARSRTDLLLALALVFMLASTKPALLGAIEMSGVAVPLFGKEVKLLLPSRLILRREGECDRLSIPGVAGVLLLAM